MCIRDSFSSDEDVEEDYMGDHGLRPELVELAMAEPSIEVLDRIIDLPEDDYIDVWYACITNML